MEMSLSGSWDSRCSSCATTRLAIVSSIGLPMKMMRSLSSRLKMSNSRSPRAVLSMTMGTRGMAMRLEHGARLLVRAPLGEQHSGALEGAGAQVGQGLLGLGQGVGGDRRDHRDLGGEFEEFVAVLACEVGHRADRALVPQVLVGEGRNVGHVDAGTDHR